MPKLSEDTLKKRFQCHICNKHFRTRQGLAGHIQWKHYYLNNSNYPDLNSIMSWGKRFQSVGTRAGIPESEINQQIRIVSRWPGIVTILKSLKVDVNDKDFKYYLISAIAYMNESNQLEKRLSKKISDLFEEYKAID